MAIDTRSKRASALSALRPFILAPVLPDGTLDQGDRQHIAWCYSGILAAGAGVVRTITLPTREFALQLAARTFGLELPMREFDLRLPS